MVFFADVIESKFIPDVLIFCFISIKKVLIDQSIFVAAAVQIGFK